MPLRGDAKRARRSEQMQRGHSPSGLKCQMAWRLARGRSANADGIEALVAGCAAGSQRNRARVSHIVSSSSRHRRQSSRSSYIWEVGRKGRRERGRRMRCCCTLRACRRAGGAAAHLGRAGGPSSAAGPSQGAWVDLAALPGASERGGWAAGLRCAVRKTRSLRPELRVACDSNRKR